MTGSSPLDFTMSENVVDGRTVVTLGGDLDVIAAAQLAEALRHHLDGDAPLLVDLTEVVFMDSSGLAAILKTPSVSERERILLAPSRHPQPRRLLEMTGALGLFRTA